MLHLQEPLHGQFRFDGYIGTFREKMCIRDRDLSDPHQQAAAEHDTREVKREPVRAEKTVGRNDPCLLYTSRCV